MARITRKKNSKKKTEKQNRFPFFTTYHKFLLIAYYYCTRKKNAKMHFFSPKNIVFFPSKNVFMSFYQKTKLILRSYYTGKNHFVPCYLNLFFFLLTHCVIFSYTLLIQSSSCPPAPPPCTYIFAEDGSRSYAASSHSN